ncbi:MAG TPA: S8 family serine peptidase, partial [Methylomirabilota bacterium]|nr:S8 family serine peptidase [Methylomirabilota bacterium]
MLCFLGAVYFWRLGNRWNQEKAALSSTNSSSVAADPSQASNQPIKLLSATAHATNANPRLAFQLNNTAKTSGQLLRVPTAILLENAVIDTALPGGAPVIPESLRFKGDPGTYIVQSRGALDDRFRQLLKTAGASIVSFVPNNAYLVRVDANGAEQLRSQAQAVLPYEPYYKLKSTLLRQAIQREPLPQNSTLNVLLFADASEATTAALRDLGSEILGQGSSPFGPVVTIKPPTDKLTAIAGLAGVQEIELARRRVFANDLSRQTIGVSIDSVTPDNYLGLTGSNIIVNVNDSGVDASHPDLASRVILMTNDLFSGVDTAGHGTHVAGIIAGSGAVSDTVKNAQGSIMPGVVGQFRGRAPGAKIFSMNVDLALGTFGTDAFLQETAARTNALISNNSWHFFGDFDYGLG